MVTNSWLGLRQPNEPATAAASSRARASETGPSERTPISRQRPGMRDNMTQRFEPLCSMTRYKPPPLACRPGSASVWTLRADN